MITPLQPRRLRKLDFSDLENRLMNSDGQGSNIPSKNSSAAICRFHVAWDYFSRPSPDGLRAGDLLTLGCGKCHLALKIEGEFFLYCHADKRIMAGCATTAFRHVGRLGLVEYFMVVALLTPGENTILMMLLKTLGFGELLRELREIQATGPSVSDPVTDNSADL
jgi:hypothetical protein